jgi:hypothetical protein
MLTIGQREITGPGTSTHLATALASDLHSKQVWPTPSGSAPAERLLAPGQARRLRARLGAQITHVHGSPAASSAQTSAPITTRKSS